MPATQNITDEMQRCAQECHRCHDMCLETISFCLHEGGAHAEPDHIRLLMDCEQICRTSEDFLHRGSNLHEHTCRACAEICERCAEDCAKLEGEHMQKCAQTCRSCAKSCRMMSA